VRHLLGVLQRLVAAGNSVLVVEHNLDVIKAADWIVDMGPEGGAGGGLVIAEGTPEQVAESAKSYTGQFLKTVLPQKGKPAAAVVVKATKPSKKKTAHVLATTP
jgi:excinuclease ABC subunit A